MTPALLALSGTTYLDGAYTAAVLATWALGLRIVAGERDVSAALLFGIGAGLAFGIKPTSLVLVLPILLVVTLLILTRGPASIRSRLTQLAALGLPVLVLGASWYLKNLSCTATRSSRSASVHSPASSRERTARRLNRVRWWA